MSYTRVPAVRLPPRPVAPPPEGALWPKGESRLTPAERALIERRQAHRLAKAEERTLVPEELDEVKRRLLSERAVEENLARGRAITRYEIRRETDMRSFGKDRGRVRFPEPACPLCDLVALTLACLGVVVAPFAALAAILAAASVEIALAAPLAALVALVGLFV